MQDNNRKLILPAYHLLINDVLYKLHVKLVVNFRTQYLVNLYQEIYLVKDHQIVWNHRRLVLIKCLYELLGQLIELRMLMKFQLNKNQLNILF
jgi:hypothetical protein